MIWIGMDFGEYNGRRVCDAMPYYRQDACQAAFEAAILSPSVQGIHILTADDYDEAVEAAMKHFTRKTIHQARAREILQKESEPENPEPPRVRNTPTIETVDWAMTQTAGRHREAAALLNVTPKTLCHWLRKPELQYWKRIKHQGEKYAMLPL